MHKERKWNHNLIQRNREKKKLKNLITTTTKGGTNQHKQCKAVFAWNGQSCEREEGRGGTDGIPSVVATKAIVLLAKPGSAPARRPPHCYCSPLQKDDRPSSSSFKIQPNMKTLARIHQIPTQIRWQGAQLVSLRNRTSVRLCRAAWTVQRLGENRRPLPFLVALTVVVARPGRYPKFVTFAVVDLAFVSWLKREFWVQALLG